MEISALSSLIHSLFHNQFIYLFVSVILRIKPRLSNMLSKHSTNELRLGTSHMALVTTSRAVTALEGAGALCNYTKQQGRILSNGRDRCLSHLHTPNAEARATLTVYHPLALEHLQVNQLLQRNRKILSVLDTRLPHKWRIFITSLTTAVPTTNHGFGDTVC